MCVSVIDYMYVRVHKSLQACILYASMIIRLYISSLALNNSSHCLSIEPPSKPTSFMVPTIESDSITLSWSAPNSNGGREVIVYHVEYEEVGSLDGFVRSNMQEITTNNYIIEGLKPVTTYIVRVIAENGVGFFEASPADVERRSAELVITTGEGRKSL